MAKSLKEIETTFYKKYQQEKSQEESKIEKNSKKKKTMLISDIIFCIAMAGAGFFAFVLSWSEQEGFRGMLYNVLESYRGVALALFVILIVVSFALQFVGNREEK